MNHPAPSKIDPRILEVEQARLARFFQSINKHRKVLDLAIEQDFDGTRSGRMEKRLRVHRAPRRQPHDGRYRRSLGHSQCLRRDPQSQRRLAPDRPTSHRRPHAEQVFKALAADKGLTAAQAMLLNEFYVLEGRLEHASPDVDADEVRKAVERLREALPGLIESAHTWLCRHGVELR